MKRLLICAALAVVAACASVHKGSADGDLRVMTWNIAAGHGDLSKIAEVIGKSGAEIVALQEVDVRWSERSAFADQADSLAKLLAASGWESRPPIGTTTGTNSGTNPGTGQSDDRSDTPTA